MAAGVASLMSLLALRHGLIPANAEFFSRPNSRLEIDKTPFM
jgi:acyl transferase domain-containing protein